MTDKEVLERYIPMVDFIADICGLNYEVLLHDVKKPEASVIAIRNGFHSGRSVGSPMTDLALKIIKDKSYLDNEYIANYVGNTKDKQFYSSTYYVKNDGNLIGMLCINNDMTPLNDLKSAFDAFTKTLNFGEKAKDYSESISNPLTSLANTIITKTIADFHITPRRMSSDEKMQVVHSLNDKGVLMLKGAVSDVAEQLHISEGTVYRYINKKQ